MHCSLHEGGLLCIVHSQSLNWPCLSLVRLTNSLKVARVTPPCDTQTCMSMCKCVVYSSIAMAAFAYAYTYACARESHKLYSLKFFSFFCLGQGFAKLELVEHLNCK